jgi:hypothetical protein
MATQAKRSRKQTTTRKTRRPAARRTARARKPSEASAANVRVARTLARSSAAAPAVRSMAGWSTLGVMWRPALAMATLPYRMYRVYRWAEAASHRAGYPAPSAS